MTVVLRLTTGFTVGSALTIACMLQAAGGHGLYFPLAIVSAPGGAFGGMVGAWLGAPALWMVLAVLAGKPTAWVPIAMHGCAIPLVFLMEPGFADFERFARVPGNVQAAAVATFAGHSTGLAWMLYLQVRAAKRDT